LPPGGRKACSAAKRNRSRRRRDARIHTGSIGLGVVASEARPDEIFCRQVSNFEQTVAAWSGNFQPPAG
jgi:hypothetical protein